jgi:signal transduction histidine kinase
MKTILIVEDDRQLRGMFVRALERKGYRVIEADSGPPGLILARQYLPDLILSDIHMPGGDGSTLLRNIRHDPELRGKQVVLMTGRPDLITPRRGMEDGADDFLVKPVEINALLNCVEARLARGLISWRVEDQMLARLRTLVPPQLPHEFFTPLAGIIGLMDILRSDFPSMDSKEVVEIHDDIYQSAIRLHRTLRNYLLILELQNAPPPAHASPLAPADVEKNVRSGVTEALRQNDRQDDVTIQVNACAIAIKPGDLSRIVEELVDNACKFSRHGTPIRVDLTPGRQLTITDQGRGLTAEEIGRIGVFQQFDRSKHEQQGLGLGLVLVQKLASQYGASFQIESQPGEGTTVRVVFP